MVWDIGKTVTIHPLISSLQGKEKGNPQTVLVDDRETRRIQRVSDYLWKKFSLTWFLSILSTPCKIGQDLVSWLCFRLSISQEGPLRIEMACHLNLFAFCRTRDLLTALVWNIRPCLKCGKSAIVCSLYYQQNFQSGQISCNFVKSI